MNTNAAWRESHTRILVERNKSDKQRRVVSEKAQRSPRNEAGQFISTLNHKVSRVEKLNEKYDVYDLTVDKYHNFGLEVGVFVHNCVGWDLMDLLVSGFKGVPGKIESAPAKHFRTALGQIVNFFYTLQGEAAGAQAFSNLDTLLAPFIAFDKLTYAEVKQCLQEFIFNINVPTRVGFQTPFTNVTLDLTVPSYYKDHPVIIGGEPQGVTYGQFQYQVNMFNRAFLEVMLEGDALGRVFTFPIPTYNITKDFDWDNPIMDLLWELTAKYGVPYFANYINSDMNPEDARSMCCRLRIDNRSLEKKGGGLFGAAPLTGSIGVVTINMPHVADKVLRGECDFHEEVARLMNLASTSLEIKRKAVERFTDNNLYPYAKFYLRSVKERFDSYWKNHFSTIGLVGMNEACEKLLNGNGVGSNVGRMFTLQTLDLMRHNLLIKIGRAHV